MVRDVLARTGTSPRQVDILVINCSLFSPTPSLCAMVAHAPAAVGWKRGRILFLLERTICSFSVFWGFPRVFFMPKKSCFSTKYNLQQH